MARTCGCIAHAPCRSGSCVFQFSPAWSVLLPVPFSLFSVWSPPRVLFEAPAALHRSSQSQRHQLSAQPSPEGELLAWKRDRIKRPLEGRRCPFPLCTMRPAAMAAEGIALLQDAVLTAARILGDPVSASDIVRLLGVRNDEGVGEGNVVRTVVAMLKAEHRLRADDTGAGSGFVSAKDAVGEHGAVAATLTGKRARGGSTGEKEPSLKQGRVSALDARLALRESQLVAALERRLHEFEQKLVPGCDAGVKAAALGAAAGEGSCSKPKERVMQDHMGTPLAAVDVDRLCAVRSRPLTTAAAHLGTRPPLDVWKEHIHMYVCVCARVILRANVRVFLASQVMAPSVRSHTL